MQTVCHDLSLAEVRSDSYYTGAQAGHFLSKYAVWRPQIEHHKKGKRENDLLWQLMLLVRPPPLAVVAIQGPRLPMFGWESSSSRARRPVHSGGGHQNRLLRWQEDPEPEDTNLYENNPDSTVMTRALLWTPETCRLSPSDRSSSWSLAAPLWLICLTAGCRRGPCLEAERLVKCSRGPWPPHHGIQLL